jgi:drug/metabolite transporter (DMT)-like permease
MIALLPAVAALSASFGWASGIVLAQWPARQLGTFEFTRIQLIACAALMSLVSSVLGLWPAPATIDIPAYTLSVVGGVLLGNLAMIECLRRGGLRLTELLLCLKAPLVALIAYIWLGETLSLADITGAGVVITGIVLAIQANHADEGPKTGARKILGPVVLLGIAAAALQGGGFLAVKPMLEQGAEPIAVAAIRLTGAAGLVILISLWPAASFKPKSEPNAYLVVRTILPGVIGYGFSSSLLLYAFAHMEAGIAAVLGSLSPLFVLPILWLKTKMRPDPRAIAGAFLAVTGTAIIVLG